MADQSTQSNPYAPFVHPRRDRYLSRARHSAALFLSLVQAAWFVAYLLAIRAGTPLSPPFAILGLAGIFLIASRAGQAAEIALGISDRLASMETAPSRAEILRRTLMALVFPFALMTTGFLVRERPELVYASIISLIVFEGIFRLGGHTVWRGKQIAPAVLKELLRGSAENAVRALSEQPALTPDQIEVSALAISGISLRTKNVSGMRALEEMLNQKAAASSPEEKSIIERALAVIRADLARLDNDEAAAEPEARALRLVPVGHPRRLALGLFVATAALDQEDPESALKALQLLHSRDVIRSTGRVLVDWLMLQAARSAEDTQAAKACSKALKTFDLERVTRDMHIESLRGENDAYSRWMVKAREDLKSGGVS